MGKADVACSLIHHNDILSLPTTLCFMAHPVVKYWKPELLVASMNLVLVFTVPHTSSPCWKILWKELKNILQSFQWEPMRALN